MGAPPIYLDYLATTPVDPRVLEAMLPFFTRHFGNPSSATHAYGWAAKEAVEGARAQVAGLIGAVPHEIVFTSGATEANNLALKGAAEFHRSRASHLLTCVTEHKAVLDACRRLEGQGFRVVYLPVDRRGQVDLGQLEAAITGETILLSLMAANNEIGTLHPLERIGALARGRGVLWHCDAAQAAGKVPLDVEKLGVDLLAISGHKLYGPKGVGALYVRRRPRARLLPLLDGGGQERGLRAGTLNVPGIVGLGMACELARRELEEEARRLKHLRQHLWQRLSVRLEGVEVNGHPEERLPGNLHLSFAGVDGAELLLALPELALSSSSACTSGSAEPSHVLKAIGQSLPASLRFGLGRFNTEIEIDTAADLVAAAVGRLRARAGEHPGFHRRPGLAGSDN
ncbi:MAG: aminotransferase class V-fold PLP-dependent enzyme [Candidatus Handelsmanbacteria bacterium]|nr:aminotransferase class V-fold PLP-dependent enzyme [Candidatus Handelsmanbacteria bacterium]